MDAIKKATEELSAELQKIGPAMQQANPEPAAPNPEPGAEVPKDANFEEKKDDATGQV